MTRPSRRQELREYMETGRLRDATARDLSTDAQDLLVDLVARYCEDRTRRRPTRNVWQRVVPSSDGGAA